MNASSLPNRGSETTIDLRSWKSQHDTAHHHRHIRTIHGSVNIIGWGILLPIGLIIARYYRKLPWKCNEWYSLHILCQVSGFILGTIGWGIGLSLKNMSEHQTMSTHGVLGTIIFTVATIQVLAICLQPREEHECRRYYWVMYHQLLGHALIALIISNIFLGIDCQTRAKIWRWFYVAILGVFGLTVVPLEIFRWMIFFYKAPTRGIE